MTTTIRFPNPSATPEGLPSQADQIITLMNGATGLAAGGALYVPLFSWKQNAFQSPAPYTCVMLEFTANAALTVGDGSASQLIGLFGENPGGRFFLGLLGVTLAASQPQIPIISNTIGYAQAVQNVAAYDALAIGTLAGALTFPTDVALTVRARPIIKREYLG